MRNDRLSRELDIILMLAGTDDYTVGELCREAKVSRRTLYYYIECLRECGFDIYKSSGCYHIDRRSPFLSKLLGLLQFTEDEAVTLKRLVDMAGTANPTLNGVRRKLERFYDFSILSDVELRRKSAHIVSVLYEAIKQKRVAKLCGYSSPHSKTQSDRYVEPFRLMNGNNDVRCYEIATGECKTFRISRMADAEMLELLWSCEQQHRDIYTDCFMFSSEEQREVKLRLGRLAYNVFTEEHPDATDGIVADRDRWLLTLKVCSYKGVGRFVLGLYGDIEVVGDDGFRSYISQTIAEMAAKSGAQT